MESKNPDGTVNFEQALEKALEKPAQEVRLGGTGYAAPIMSGGIALLQSACPDLKPDQVKAILLASKNPDGTVDFQRALEMARA